MEAEKLNVWIENMNAKSIQRTEETNKWIDDNQAKADKLCEDVNNAITWVKQGVTISAIFCIIATVLSIIAIAKTFLR